jgi:hypothetical protein
MRRHPIDKHADAGLVAGVDENWKSSGVPKREVGAK